MRVLLSSPRSLAVFLAALLTCSACAGEEPAETGAVIDDTSGIVDAAPADTGGSGVQVGVAQQEPYGEFLVDADGRTLYLFTADTKGQSSACYDDCADAWPPLLTPANPDAGAPGVNAAMLGTIERRDGTLQGTYNGWPLYYYREDRGAGQVTGQDVHGFGGEWYLISPQGEKIEAEAGSGGS